VSAARSASGAAASRPRAYTRLEAALGIGLSPALLEQALTHRSYAYEHGGLPNNERLEFLGDAVLGLVVTEELFRTHPDLAEGQLAKLRASVVSTRALAEVAREIGLGEWVRLGRGEVTTGGDDKSSILADTTEAVIGAVFIERGHEVATQVVRRLVGPSLERALQAGASTDWKTALQELTAARGSGAPVYVLAGSGPDHARRFVAQVLVAGEVSGHGEGGTKKEAEQQAAQIAFQGLEALAALEQSPTLPALPD
jgi:ribonuclease-3